MTPEVLIEKIQLFCLSLDKNFRRIDFAFGKTKLLLPLTREALDDMDDSQISLIDQYIFRFAKIQDLLGEKLFRLLIVAAGEEVESLTFNDILNKLERFAILDYATKWKEIRSLRNEIAHEYPLLNEEAVVSLNQLFYSLPYLKEVYNNCLLFLEKNLPELKFDSPK